MPSAMNVNGFSCCCCCRTGHWNPSLVEHVSIFRTAALGGVFRRVARRENSGLIDDHLESSHSICAGIVNAKLVQQSPSSRSLLRRIYARTRTRRVSLSLPTFASARF